MTPTIPPSPTVGDVITTAGELDALPVDAIVRGDDGRPWQRALRSMDPTTVWRTLDFRAYFPATAGGLLPAVLLYRPDAPPAAPTAGVDREALVADITLLLESARNRCSCCAEVDGELTDAANRLRMALAAQPTPAPAVEDREGVRRAVRAIYDVRRARAGLEPISDSDFGRGSGPDAYGDTWDEARAAFLATRQPAPADADAVERAVMAAVKCDVRVEDADCAHMDDSMPCSCETRFSYCVEHDWEEPQDPSVTVCPWAARIARAALAAARAGEVQR